MKAKYQTIKGVKFKIVDEEEPLHCSGCVLEDPRPNLMSYCLAANCFDSVIKFPKSNKYTYIYTDVIHNSDCTYLEAGKIYKAVGIIGYPDCYNVNLKKDGQCVIWVKPDTPSSHTNSQWFKIGE